MTIITTNTPRPGDTPQQIAARSAPRGEIKPSAPDTLPAKNFHLTEPSRGVYVVNYRVGEKLRRMTISRAQLANFLVDGAAIAHRSELLNPENGAGGKQPAPPASALPRPLGDADASIFRETH